MNKSQLRGYLLEIVLSKLIEINGYELISAVDGKDIVQKGNGLNLRGRGGYHQFDTLGKFKITPPFIYPLRLFVEAKFYSGKKKVGIEKVRMGIGILHDVNTNYSTVTMSNDELNTEKYNYNYAIFSTSGFTEPAQRLAIAHKIHLIDLQGNEYQDILNIIREIADIIYIINNFDKNSMLGNNIYIDKFRKFILNDDDSFIYYLCEHLEYYSCKEFESLCKKLKGILSNNLLYLASINSPHIIPLFSNKKFNEKLINNPHQKISLTWDTNNINNWDISLDNDIKISFTLPKLLRKYLISNMNDNKDSEISTKENYLNKFVFISYLDKINPTICTLKFDYRKTENELRLLQDD